MATYRLKARRFLRRYTAAARTPVYAAESDAATAAAEIWSIPWTEAEGAHTAVFPPHDAEDAVAGRDLFDAAEWCDAHADGMHAVHAQMACYRMALPAAMAGKRLTALTVRVSSDPYNPAGARIAVATNSTGEIPAARNDVLEGAAFASGVSPRRVETEEDGTATWFGASADVRIAPTGGLVLGTHLYVFVSLEDYARSRGGRVEGASALAPEIAVDMAAVPGYADGAEIDCRSAGGRELPLCRGGVLPYLREEDRFVRSYECLAAGGDLPDAKEHSPQKTDELGVWRGTTRLISLASDARGVRICPSEVLQLKFNSTTPVCERIVAVLGVTRAEAQTEWIPGVAFFYGGSGSTEASLAGSSYAGNRMRFQSLTYADLGANSTDDVREILSPYFTSNPAYLDLARGTATGVSFVDNVYGSRNASYHTTVAARQLLVFVSGANGINLLGMFRLTGGAYYYAAQTGYSGTAQGLKFIPYTGSEQAAEGDVKYLLTTQDRATAYSSFFEYSAGRVLWYREWLYMVFNTYCGVTLTDSAIQVTGHDTVPYEGRILGVSAYAGSSSDSFIVYGELASVGGRPCRNVAIVSCRSKTPTVWIPSIDERITPDTYEHYQVNTVWGGTPGRERFLVTGTFSRLSGGAFAGSAMADSSTGELSGGVAGASAHAAVLGGAALSASCVWYVTGNYVRNFTARRAEDLAIPAPTPEQSCVGLRNAYAKLAQGDCTRVAVRESAQPGAAFTVRRTKVSVPSTADGVTEGRTEVAMWRVSATAGLVPFSTPDGFRARGLRLDWGGVSTRATEGSVFCVWLKRGAYLRSVPEEILASPALHDGSAGELDGWELVGRIDAAGAATSAEFRFDEIAERTGTLLLAAYVPQDGLPAASEGGGPWGVGEVDADGVNGTVAALATGWRPDATLLG